VFIMSAVDGVNGEGKLLNPVIIFLFWCKQGKSVKMLYTRISKSIKQCNCKVLYQFSLIT